MNKIPKKQWKILSMWIRRDIGPAEALSSKIQAQGLVSFGFNDLWIRKTKVLKNIETIDNIEVLDPLMKHLRNIFYQKII